MTSGKPPAQNTRKMRAKHVYFPQVYTDRNPQGLTEVIMNLYRAVPDRSGYRVLAEVQRRPTAYV